ncbi:hypothetical protein I3842_13G154100 [Carya illinoinensis]|uniref:Bifunctional inhibitor/plant lipid transfer protein/seed storage helical domain-containing protein n=1 Tax=Carya illinoinensis TaxID=32201 RepID=A0A922DE13_CARIL|nr:hypothetical protein I3842_13G154100 [Carya illinoinensis]
MAIIHANMNIRRSLGMAILVMVATTLMHGNHIQVSAQCGANIPVLIAECSDFVGKSGPKVPPSQDCCAALSGVDIPCMCKRYAQQIENIVSMEKLVFVFQTCGLTVPHGLQCGSSTVP